MLDEPTAGLDLLAREQVLAAVQAMAHSGPERPTIVLITHHLEELPPATSDVLLLSDGKCAARGRWKRCSSHRCFHRSLGAPLR